MKYSELISFSPIESTLQLIQSNSNKAEEINNIKTYVMSEGMAQSMKAPVIDQLQMDEVVDIADLDIQSRRAEEGILPIADIG